MKVEFQPGVKVRFKRPVVQKMLVLHWQILAYHGKGFYLVGSVPAQSVHVAHEDDLVLAADPADDGPEVEIIQRERQIEYDERVAALKQKFRFSFPRGD